MHKVLFLVAFLTLIFIGLYQFNDRASIRIEADIYDRVVQGLTHNGLSSRSDTQITVSVDGRDVTLVGHTSTASLRNHIEGITKQVFGVRAVKSSIRVPNNVFKEPEPKPIVRKTGPITVTTSPTVNLQDATVIDKIVCDPDVCADNSQKIDTQTEAGAETEPTPLTTDDSPSNDKDL